MSTLRRMAAAARRARLRHAETLSVAQAIGGVIALAGMYGWHRRKPDHHAP
jgi:hypothetical protein